MEVLAVVHIHHHAIVESVGKIFGLHVPIENAFGKIVGSGPLTGRNTSGVLFDHLLCLSVELHDLVMPNGALFGGPLKRCGLLKNGPHNGDYFTFLVGPFVCGDFLHHVGQEALVVAEGVHDDIVIELLGQMHRGVTLHCALKTRRGDWGVEITGATHESGCWNLAAFSALRRSW